MAGSLVSFAPSESAIRGIGVFIREVPPPGTVSGLSQGVVGVVGEFPWGPEGAAYEPTSAADLRDTMFGPAGLGHKSWRAFYGKRFGRVICSRVLGADATAASVTIEDAASGGDPSLQATARGKGAAGNNIEVILTANADTSTSRDVTVRFTRADGTLYTATYRAFQTSDGSVTDPGDPYVAFETATGATGPAHPGTYKLGQAVADPVSASTQGSDGTINAAAYAAALAKLGGVSSPVAIVFATEPTSAVSEDDVNGVLFTFAASNVDKIVVLRTPAGESVSDALSDVASFRGENVVRLKGLVKQRLPNADGDLEVTLTDGNAFAAAMMANTDPWISPGSKEAAAFAREILDLEDTTLDAEAYATLVEGGVAPWFMSTKLGAMIRGAVTTSLDRAVNRIRARRYKTYVGRSIAAFLEDYVDSPLDLNVVRRELGPNTSAQVGAIRAFLEAEKRLGHLVAYEIDPFEAMDVGKYALGRWDIVIRIQDVPGAEQIVLRLQQGPSVQI